MSDLQVTRVIDLVTLWNLVFNELDGAASIYMCRMRSNYEPGEFMMVHPQEFVNMARNPTRLYLMLKKYTSSRGSIDNCWKSYIEFGGQTRKTLYQVYMIPPAWLELLDHVDDPKLAPLRTFYASMIDDGEVVRERLAERMDE